MSEQWRVFCAFELPPDLRERLRDRIGRLREAFPDVAASWTRVENIHLTLKFFGNVEVDRIRLISEAATQAVKDFSSFRVGVRTAGVFPKPRRPQVLWIGLDDPPGKLSKLHQRFEEECGRAGFEREDRVYRPHLTIARIRRPEGAPRLAETHLQIEFEPGEIEVKELIVFRSELGSGGSKYTAISRHQLQS